MYLTPVAPNVHWVVWVVGCCFFAVILLFVCCCIFTGPLFVCIVLDWCVYDFLNHSEQFFLSAFFFRGFSLCCSILFQMSLFIFWCSFISIRLFSFRWNLEGLYFFQNPFVILQSFGLTSSFHLIVSLSRLLGLLFPIARSFCYTFWFRFAR